MTDPDRRVHARSEMKMVEIVRYDRQGRWYREWRDGARTRLTVQQAAAEAVDLKANGGVIFEGIHGGRQFDAKVAGATRRQGAKQ